MIFLNLPVKLVTSFLFVMLTCVSLLYVSSCKKDNCKNGNCLNNGTCVDGDCICVHGFTGTKCEIDPCANITCLNGSTCSEGTCDCATGYEGVNCETEMRAKFITTAANAVIPNCYPIPPDYNYLADIVIGDSVNYIKIKFPRNFPCTGYIFLNARITSTNTIFIPEQTICSGTGYISKVEAAGTLINGVLTINGFLAEWVDDPPPAITSPWSHTLTLIIQL